VSSSVDVTALGVTVSVFLAAEPVTVIVLLVDCVVVLVEVGMGEREEEAGRNLVMQVS